VLTMTSNIRMIALVAALLAALFAGALPQVNAQTQPRPSAAPAAIPTPVVTADTSPVVPALSGTTLDKKPFQLESLKGKVVLLMFWSTDCAVCRDKMPELRENIRGWADKPFELVLVNVDRSMRDVDAYNDIINTSVPLKQRFTQLWTGGAGYKDNLGTAQLSKNQLPVTFLIDKNGKLIERNNGRIPATWWDVISDLL
jgi:thiol-disulfide isomerase/thioredoxin